MSKKFSIECDDYEVFRRHSDGPLYYFLLSDLADAMRRHIKYGDNEDKQEVCEELRSMMLDTIREYNMYWEQP